MQIIFIQFCVYVTAVTALARDCAARGCAARGCAARGCVSAIYLQLPRPLYSENNTKSIKSG